MSDAFTRQRLNVLTGLTTYTQKSGASTALTQSAWTALDLVGISDPTDIHLIISAYSLITDATDAVMRMVVDGNKIFPFPASVEVLSGLDQYLHTPIQIPVGHSFSIEIFTDEAAKTANVDYLSTIEVGTYDHG
jgi:hypothetical protein